MIETITQLHDGRFDNIPDNTILVTLDVTALFSCIPHNDDIGACKNI